MKKEIENALNPLLHQTLSGMWRYSGHQRFEFGRHRLTKNKRGQAVTTPDYAIVVACGWRISKDGNYLVSSSDYGPEGIRDDERGQQFFELTKKNPPLVEAIEVDDHGSVHLLLSEGHTLDIFFVGISAYENWRLILRDKRRKIFLVEKGDIDHE